MADIQNSKRYKLLIIRILLNFYKIFYLSQNVKNTAFLAELEASKNHKASHSLLLVMVTTFGLGESVHNRIVNAEVTLANLFR